MKSKTDYFPLILLPAFIALTLLHPAWTSPAYAAKKTLKMEGFLILITPGKREPAGERYVTTPAGITAHAVLKGGPRRRDLLPLSGPGEWKIIDLGSGRYAVRYKMWTDMFWEIDVNNARASRVTGAAFGEPGGRKAPLSGLEIKTEQNAVAVYLSSPRLEMERGGRLLKIFFGGTIVHSTGLKKVRETGKDVYQLAFRVARHLRALEIDFIGQSAREIETEQVFSGDSSVPFITPVSDGAYGYYFNSLGFSVWPGARLFGLDGASRRLPPGLQTHAEDFVLSYGQDWEVENPESDVYLLRYRKWEDGIFWKVDAKKEKLYELRERESGSRAVRIQGAAFRRYAGSPNVSVSLPCGHLEFNAPASRFMVYCNDRVFHIGDVLSSENIGIDVYRITNKLASGNVFSWDVDFAMQSITLANAGTDRKAAGEIKEAERRPAPAPKAGVDDIEYTNMDRAEHSTRGNDFAVVIGNRDYRNAKEVKYALNDASLVKRYLVEVMGFREGNVFYLEDATKGIFELFFGTASNHKGKLYNHVKRGKSNVFVYYSGHGAPGLKDRKGYFVPVEADPNYIELGGYSLETFYKNLSELPAASITVVMDSCFSGAAIFDNISPIVLEIEDPVINAKNVVVLSSTSGSQVSTWFDEKGHGMFTYFFLKAIHNKNADYDGDGKLTFEEIFRFVSDDTEGVPYYARRVHGVEQNPTIEGKYRGKVLVTY